ncbi:hypothetical protein HYS91_00035 [Candidatus Daviesbacteria bacterium]|nr:hypothetical protein [Candidatus Daviesbacteria bacterium]
MPDSLKELSTKKNIVNLLVLAIISLALPLGLRGLREQLVLRSQAAQATLNFRDPNVETRGGVLVATAPEVGVILTPPWPASNGSEDNGGVDNGDENDDNNGGDNGADEDADDSGPTGDARIDWGDSKCGGYFTANVRKAGDETGRAQGVKVTIKKGDKTKEAVTDSKGDAQFVNMSKGEFEATIQLPSGYKMSKGSNVYNVKVEYCAGEDNHTRGDRNEHIFEIEKTS